MAEDLDDLFAELDAGPAGGETVETHHLVPPPTSNIILASSKERGTAKPTYDDSPPGATSGQKATYGSNLGSTDDDLFSGNIISGPTGGYSSGSTAVPTYQLSANNAPSYGPSAGAAAMYGGYSNVGNDYAHSVVKADIGAKNFIKPKGVGGGQTVGGAGDTGEDSGVSNEPAKTEAMDVESATLLKKYCVLVLVV